jgi:predicted transposase YdaD
MKLDEARAEARKEGRKEAEEKRNLEFVENLLSSTSFTLERIAGLAGVSVTFVNKVKTSLKVK